MSAAVKISSKYQIVIPKEVRERQGWRPGQKLAFIPKGAEGYTLVAVPTIEELRGIAKGVEVGEYRDRTDRLDRYT